MLLDSSNVAVYKQLYRAAKAKSKLKLRVTRTDFEEPVVPKPVTVEDTPEGTTDVGTESEPTLTVSPTVEDTEDTPEAEPVVEAQLPAQSIGSSLFKSYEEAVLKEAAKIADPAEIRRKLDSMLAQESRDAAIRSAEALNALINTSTAGFECARFAICCNSCEKTTPDVHYHCSTCEDGDFDLCQSCVDQGITCHSGDHWLIKRTTKDGQIVTSTTETIAPKRKSSPVFPSVEAKAALARLEETMSKLNLSMRTCNSCVEGKSPKSSNFLGTIGLTCP